MCFGSSVSSSEEMLQRNNEIPRDVVDTVSDELDCIEEDLDNIDEYLMDEYDDEDDDDYEEYDDEIWRLP